MKMVLDKDLIGLLTSCCCSVILLEAVLKSTVNNNKENTSSAVGTLLTCCQFLTVTILTGFKTKLKENKVSGNENRGKYLQGVLVLTLIGLFFSSSILGNWAYEMDVPVPVHALVKSGSLVCTALLNTIILGTSYSNRKKLAMILVTAGVALCGIVAHTDKGIQTETETNVDMENGGKQVLGIGLLILSLLFGAMTGLVQERLFRVHGISFEAVLFISHALPLPFMFVFASSSLIEGYRIVNESSGLVPVPLLLISSCLAQYYCVTTVSRFASKRSSVTVAFVLTLRKFVSILLSVFLFDSTFTLVHWISAALVFFGTVLYADDSEKKIKEKIAAESVKM